MNNWFSFLVCDYYGHHKKNFTLYLPNDPNKFLEHLKIENNKNGFVKSFFEDLSYCFGSTDDNKPGFLSVIKLKEDGTKSRCKKLEDLLIKNFKDSGIWKVACAKQPIL